MDLYKYHRAPLIIAIVLGLSFSSVGCNEKGGGKADTKAKANTEVKAKDSKVVATVNGEPIFQSELDDYRTARHIPPGRADDKKLLDDLVTQKVVYQNAIKEKLDKDPKIAKELAQMRTRILLSAAVRKAMSDIKVTEQELHAEYDKLKQGMDSTEYKASHILVKDEAQAKKIIAQLGKGADFADLAKKYSTDPSSKKGGELGWFNPKQMVPQFSQALSQLEKGSYTKVPVKTRFGWHIIKLEDKRQAEPPAFDDIKARLERMLKQQKVRDDIQGLKDKADISIKIETNEPEMKKPDDAKEQKGDAQEKEKAETTTSK